MISVLIVDQRAMRLIVDTREGLKEYSYKQLADYDGEWETTDAVIVYSRSGAEAVQRLMDDIERKHDVHVPDRIKFIRKTEIDAALTHQMHNG